MEGCLERYSGKPIREWDEWWVPFVVPNVPVEKCLWIPINGKMNAIHCVWMFLFSSFVMFSPSSFVFCMFFIYLFYFLNVFFFGFSVSLLVWRFFFHLVRISANLWWCFWNLTDLRKLGWYHDFQCWSKQNRCYAFVFIDCRKARFFLRCATLPLSSTLPFIFLILSCF